MSVPGLLPGITDADRRRVLPLFRLAWGKSRRGGPWAPPEGTGAVSVPSWRGDIQARHLPGDAGHGTVVLAHPDRRYGGHWFVKEGWVDALHERGLGCLWFDQPGYGQGVAGSPFLAENVGAVLHAAAALDSGPVRAVGVSLGAFTTSLAAPQVPHLAKMVLESPYPTFASWFEERGGSVDKLAMATFRLLFRRANRALDAHAALGRSTVPALASWSAVDAVTPAHLSAAAVAGHEPVETHVVPDAAHLHLWSDEGYRARVLDFLG